MLETDYLVIGCGAVSMSFVDTMLEESDATFIIVDKHGAPGGHWNDAYPFVRLHQPSSIYGVVSTDLGSGRIDEIGSNKGFFELASGSEVVAYFEKVMRERFLPSGRVTYFPMHECVSEGRFRNLLSGAEQEVKVRKRVVDGTYFKTSVPSTHTRKFSVDQVDCIAPNDLPHRAADYRDFVILGGGKTAMDVGVWLTECGADPDSITWVVPRTSWLINREKVQPGVQFQNDNVSCYADQLDAMREASNIDDLFLGLEKAGHMLRLDPGIVPTMFHFATVSPGEKELLGSIKNVVRGERVEAIRKGELILQSGRTHSAPDGALYIDCTATSIPFKEASVQPVFEDGRITLQALHAPLVTYSAAIIAYAEAHFDDDDKRNRICRPVPLMDDMIGWATTAYLNSRNQNTWAETDGLKEWLANCRLSPSSSRYTSPEAFNDTGKAAIARIAANAPAAMEKLRDLSAERRAEMGIK